MTLSGPQFSQLHDTLLETFDRSELEQLVRFELDVSLSQIAGGGNTSETVFDLIRWADDRNRVPELIHAALKARPQNESLHALSEIVEEQDPDRSGARKANVTLGHRYAGAQTLADSQFSQLREALLDGFDHSGLRLMVRVELDVDLEHVTLGRNFVQEVEDLINWAAERGRVFDLIRGALSQNPKNAVIQELAQEMEAWELTSSDSSTQRNGQRVAPSVSSEVETHAAAHPGWVAELPPWIFGMNDPGEWHEYVDQAGKKGWVLFHQIVGPAVSSKALGNPQIADWAQSGHGVITRLVYDDLNLGARGRGAVPDRDERLYQEYASRCETFVANTPDCHIWIVGQEMNVAWFWPDGARLEPRPYVECFGIVAKAIKQIQPDAWVIPSAVNPTFSGGNELARLDGLEWFEEMVDAMLTSSIQPDGIDIHAYWPPPSVDDSEGSQFHSLDAFVQAIPDEWGHLPIFVSEVTPENNGWSQDPEEWMQQVYSDFNRRNQGSPFHPIVALLPYRWQGTRKVDERWNLAGQRLWIEDFRRALQCDYRWQHDPLARYGKPIPPAVALQRMTLAEEPLSRVQVSNFAVDAIIAMAVNSDDGILILPDERQRDRSALPDELLAHIKEHAPPSGQVRALDAASIPAAKHVIVFTIDLHQRTGDELPQGLSAALRLADRLGDVTSVAVSDLSYSMTGAASNSIGRFEYRQIVAAQLTATILSHLQRGSRLERVLIGASDDISNPVYREYGRSLGGVFGDDGVGAWVTSTDMTRIGDYAYLDQSTPLYAGPSETEALGVSGQHVLALIDGEEEDNFLPIRLTDVKRPRGLAASESTVVEVISQYPDELWPGESVTVHATLHNRGDVTLAADGVDAIEIQVHLLSQAASIVAVYSASPSEPVAPNEVDKLTVEMVAPVEPGNYSLTWYTVTVGDPGASPIPLTLSGENGRRLAVANADAVRAFAADLSDSNALSLSDRRGGFLRVDRYVDADPNGELQSFLVEELLLQGLFDVNWQIGRDALYTLYSIRDRYKSQDGRRLEEELVDLLANLDNLDAPKDLLQQRIRQDERKWLAEILERTHPAPVYSTEIDGFDLPSVVSGSGTQTITVDLRNTGNTSWLPDDEFHLACFFSESPPPLETELLFDDTVRLSHQVEPGKSASLLHTLADVTLSAGEYALDLTVESVTHAKAMAPATLTKQWIVSEPPRRFSLAVEHAGELPARDSFVPRLTLTNIGNGAWPAGERIRVKLSWRSHAMATVNPSLPPVEPVPPIEIELDAAVPPGDSNTLPWPQPLTAPAEADEYTVEWIAAGVGWDAQATDITNLLVVARYDAVISADVPLSAWPGQTLDTRVQITNRGQEGWASRSMQVEYWLLPEASEDSPLETAVQVIEPSLAALGNGDKSEENSVNIDFQRALPDTPGNYRLRWQVQHLGDHGFAVGKPFIVALIVRGAADATLQELLDLDSGTLAGLPEDLRAQRLAEIGRLVGDNEHGAIRASIIRHQLLDGLEDASPAVRQAASNALYALRSVYEETDTLVAERLAQEESVRETVGELSSNPHIAPDERRWLADLMPGLAPRPSRSPQIVVVAPALVEPDFVEHQRIPTLAVRVDVDSVTATFDGQRYRSRNLLQDATHKNRVEGARKIAPQDYGQLLFDAIFNPVGKDGLESTYNGYVIARQAAHRQLRLELSLADEMAPYQWEYLRNRYDRTPADRPGPPLAVYADAPFYRRYSNMDGRPSIDAKPLKLLAAICNPVDLGTATGRDGSKIRAMRSLHPLDVEEEIGLLASGLASLRGQVGQECVADNGALVEYEFYVSGVDSKPLTLANLVERAKDCQVLHVVTHGIHWDRVPYLLLEDAERKIQEVSAEDFSKALAGLDLRLVVLVACQTAYREADAGALPDFGALLMQNGVRAVVAMQGILHDNPAKLFTARFYSDLARTGRIDMAMASTRLILFIHDEKRWDWGFPVLFMRDDDGHLFQVDASKAGKRPDTQSVLAQMEASGSSAEEAVAVRSLPIGRGSVPAQSVVEDTSEESKPLARAQDRVRLGQLSMPVSIDASALATYVREHTGMELPLTVYGQVASALNTGKHVILTGPPGTGKTTLAHAICQFAHAPAQNHAVGATLTTATADWSTFDTIGGHVPRSSGALDFRPGILLEAVSQGRWLVIDEINRAEIDKAFGELFTVLSGQQVDLPYSIGNVPVRILPAAKEGAWDSQAHADGYDYVVPPTWRILGTMNVYDKSYLFGMSFAFMRRFAFVDVDLPMPHAYKRLIRSWYIDAQLPIHQLEPSDQIEGGQAEADMSLLDDTLELLIARDKALMLRRSLGPAIIKDMVAYIGDRYVHDRTRGKQVLLGYLGEAFQLYVAPQLDGLDREGAFMVYAHVHDVFHSLSAYSDTRMDLLRTILTRVELLYPHIQPDDWRNEALRKYSTVQPADDSISGE